MGIDRAEQARRLGLSNHLVQLHRALQVQGDYLRTLDAKWMSMSDLDEKEAFYQAEVLPALLQFEGNVHIATGRLQEEQRGTIDRLVSWVSSHRPAKAQHASRCKDESLLPLLQAGAKKVT